MVPYIVQLVMQRLHHLMSTVVWEGVIMSEVRAMQHVPKSNKGYDRFKIAFSAIVKVKKEDVACGME